MARLRLAIGMLAFATPLPPALGFSFSFSFSSPPPPALVDLKLGKLVSDYSMARRRDELKAALLEASDAKNEALVLEMVAALAPLNPTEVPTRGLGEEGAAGAPLDGEWRLAFTNARDAEAPARTENRAAAFSGGDELAEGVTLKTGQRISANEGMCRNFIVAEGERRPFDRLDIEIQMRALDDRRVRLDFLRGRAQNSRAPLPFLEDVSFSFPPAAVGDFFTRLKGRDPTVDPPAYFDILYIDADVRVHQTGEGKIFVQRRV